MPSLKTLPQERALDPHEDQASVSIAQEYDRSNRLPSGDIRHWQSDREIEKTLTISRGSSALSISRAFAERYQTQHIDPCSAKPSKPLVAKWCPQRCLRKNLMPWRKVGDCTIIITSRPQTYIRLRPELEACFGQVRMAVTTTNQLSQAICLQFHSELAHHAETRVPAQMSCRTWNTKLALYSGIGFVTCLILAPIYVPALILGFFTIIALLRLLTQTAIKFVAIILALKPTLSDEDTALPIRFPTITVLVPLFKEKEIAGHLLRRLKEMTYPREHLDVCLVTEADDFTTRASLGITTLPIWMRVITVPAGSVRTKPRALNYALGFAKGEIIGIYDAEDAPAPDQLEKVAIRFANRGPHVVCLQGVLDYYNPAANWLTRCFTIEYASWFHVVLPGFARMGMVVPLGGTTLFFRRDALEELGGWDAHNVTEDADLGVRLARHGYATELLHTTTEEEANGRIWPWIKQRSRWLKGYAITYVVHMRDPQKLLKDLGLWRFVAFQIQFAGTLASFVLAPILISFWFVLLGFDHPLLGLFEGKTLLTLMAIFISAELANLLAATVGVYKAKKTWLIKWALTMHLYFPLAAIAAYKGIIELVWKPFYWDKTTHGLMMNDGTYRPYCPASTAAASSLSRVT